MWKLVGKSVLPKQCAVPASRFRCIRTPQRIYFDVKSKVANCYRSGFRMVRELNTSEELTGSGTILRMQGNGDSSFRLSSSLDTRLMSNDSAKFFKPCRSFSFNDTSALPRIRRYITLSRRYPLRLQSKFVISKITHLYITRIKASNLPRTPSNPPNPHFLLFSHLPLSLTFHPLLPNLPPSHTPSNPPESLASNHPKIPSRRALRFLNLFPPPLPKTMPSPPNPPPAAPPSPPPS